VAKFHYATSDSDNTVTAYRIADDDTFTFIDAADGWIRR
jgi:hypothetical protein